MVIALIGESCTGKSTLADILAEKINAKVYSGKDYLRLAKSQEDARKKFIELLDENQQSEENIIYVISEREHIQLLPQKCLRVLLTCDIETIKERFAQRMKGNLPAPVADMLQKKHGVFDNEKYDLHIENIEENAQEAAVKIISLLD